MTPRSRDRAAMIRIALIVAAIAAGAFALNLLLFDAAESTGSAGRLSPRADLIDPAGTTTGARTTTGQMPVTAPGTTTTSTSTTPTTSTPTTTDEPDDEDSSDSGRGRGGDDDGSGRGRGRGGDDDD